MNRIRKLASAVTLATAASFTGGAMAATIDSFTSNQGPITDSVVDATEVTNTASGRTIGANLTGSTLGNNLDANIAGGAFSMSQGANTAGVARVTWTSSWSGFVSNLSSTSSIRVQVINWGGAPGATLALQLVGGGTGTASSSGGVGTINFNLASSAFSGVDLSNVTSMSVIITDPTADTDELDAAIGSVTTSDTPVPEADIPFLPPVGLAIAAIGLGGLGAWRARRKGGSK